MRAAVRLVAVDFYISEEKRPKCVSARIDQGRRKMFSEYAIALVLDLVDPVLNPYQLAVPRSSPSAKSRFLKLTLKGNPTGASSISSRFARNGKLCVPRFPEVEFRKNSYAQEPVSPNPRRESSESSLRGARDFRSNVTRVRSREPAARPIPFRAASAAADYCRRYCELFHSKGADAEAAPKWNGILEPVALSQAQAKSALTTQRAKVRTKHL